MTKKIQPEKVAALTDALCREFPDIDKDAAKVVIESLLEYPPHNDLSSYQRRIQGLLKGGSNLILSFIQADVRNGILKLLKRKD